MDQMSNPSFLPVSGRIFISFIFLITGLSKVVLWHTYMVILSTKMIPLDPIVLLISLLVEILGGLSILMGYKIRYTSMMLFLYLLPVSLIMHNFWAFSGLQFTHEFLNFLKNMAIMGGLLYLAHYGAGPFSVDRWLARKSETGVEV